MFDYNISKKYFGSKYTIVDQLIANHFYSAKEFIPVPYIEISQACELSLMDPRYSATIAYHCFVGKVKGSAILRQKSLDPSPSKKDEWNVNTFVGLNSNLLPRISKLSGIIFTGNHDGNVYVCYDPKSAIPVEYAIVDKDVVSPDQIDWKPVTEFRQDTLQANRSITDIVYEKYSDIAEFNIDTSFFKTLKFSSEALFDTYQWFFKAKKKKAKVEIDSQGTLRMSDGTWLMGTWEKGVFFHSIWNAGVFESGVFDSGT